MALTPRVVVLYDRDYLKKFRVYFSLPNQALKFEHGMRNFVGRMQITPDVVHMVTITPTDYDGSSVLASVTLDGAASQAAGAGALGYDMQFLWLRNVDLTWPKAAHVIAEVTCRWYHSHERFGDHIDNLDETRERPVL